MHTGLARTVKDSGKRLVAVGAKTGLGALLGVQSAGFWAFVIHRAAACIFVQKIAVTTRATRHGEDLVLGVEVVDHAHLQQAFGNQLGLDVFHFKRVHQFQSHQIRQTHFQRHGAAIGSAAIAHAWLVFTPGFESIHIDDSDGGFHEIYIILCTNKKAPNRSWALGLMLLI